MGFEQPLGRFPGASGSDVNVLPINLPHTQAYKTMIHHQENRKTLLTLINQGDRAFLKKKTIINEVN